MSVLWHGIFFTTTYINQTFQADVRLISFFSIELCSITRPGSVYLDSEETEQVLKTERVLKTELVLKIE